jgi:predicted nucleotidyltransferase
MEENLPPLRSIVEGREVILYALTGSHNYNLHDETSDKDYKLFVMPTFNDLYNGKEFSTTFRSPTLDFTIHDIRKLPNLFYKSNLNFLEILFSEEFGSSIHQLFYSFHTSDLKKDIARMNLPYLYNACVGMHHEKVNHLLKGTETTQVLVDKFGYDTKQALHALRVLDFLKRFCYNEFTDFKEAIYYQENDIDGWLLKDIKKGKFTLEQVKELFAEKLQTVETKCKPLYLANKADEALYSELQELIKVEVSARYLR